VLAHTDDQTPIVTRVYGKPDDLFGWRVYPKGAWVLHMLRSQLGAPLYRRAIRTYLERHALGVVTTTDLQRALEDVSGRALDAFFDQWVYHAGTPTLEIRYQWDAENQRARMSVRQTQKTSARVLLFRFPLTFRFKGEGFVEDREVIIRRASEDFDFTLPAAPRLVRVDPEYTVLARIKFTPPRPMLLAQLDDATDMLGRLFAVQALAKRKEAATVKRLGRVLREDAFYGVRSEAAKALRRIHSDDALEELLASREQENDRVTRQVLRDLRGFYADRVRDVLLELAQDCPNPDLRADSVRGLEPYVTPEIAALLRELLRVPSFRNVVANAAIQALRAQDDPASVAPLLAVLKERRDAFQTRDYGNALRALAFLAREEEDRTEVREFLQAATRSLNRQVRQAALAALGELGDPRAIPVLETFAEGRDSDDPEVQAARKAINELHAKRPPRVELDNLRREVRDLRDTQRKLREELDALKKQLEAKSND
jgi:aminopeptidase N